MPCRLLMMIKHLINIAASCSITTGPNLDEGNNKIMIEVKGGMRPPSARHATRVHQRLKDGGEKRRSQPLC